MFFNSLNDKLRCFLLICLKSSPGFCLSFCLSYCFGLDPGLHYLCLCLNFIKKWLTLSLLSSFPSIPCLTQLLFCFSFGVYITRLEKEKQVCNLNKVNVY